MVPKEVTRVSLLFYLSLLFLCRRSLSLADHVQDEMANCGTTLLLFLEKFDGSQHYDNWVSHFECVSKINGWSDHEKALWLKARMIRRAHVAFDLFSHEIQESFYLCKAALQK